MAERPRDEDRVEFDLTGLQAEIDSCTPPKAEETVFTDSTTRYDDGLAGRSRSGVSTTTNIKIRTEEAERKERQKGEFSLIMLDLINSTNDAMNTQMNKVLRGINDLHANNQELYKYNAAAHAITLKNGSPEEIATAKARQESIEELQKQEQEYFEDAQKEAQDVSQAQAELKDAQKEGDIDGIAECQQRLIEEYEDLDTSVDKYLDTCSELIGKFDETLEQAKKNASTDQERELLDQYEDALENQKKIIGRTNLDRNQKLDLLNESREQLRLLSPQLSDDQRKKLFGEEGLEQIEELKEQSALAQSMLISGLTSGQEQATLRQQEQQKQLEEKKQITVSIEDKISELEQAEKETLKNKETLTKVQNIVGNLDGQSRSSFLHGGLVGQAAFHSKNLAGHYNRNPEQHVTIQGGNVVFQDENGLYYHDKNNPKAEKAYLTDEKDIVSAMDQAWLQKKPFGNETRFGDSYREGLGIFESLTGGTSINKTLAALDEEQEKLKTTLKENKENLKAAQSDLKASEQNLKEAAEIVHHYNDALTLANGGKLDHIHERERSCLCENKVYHSAADELDAQKGSTAQLQSARSLNLNGQFGTASGTLYSSEEELAATAKIEIENDHDSTKGTHNHEPGLRFQLGIGAV
jgi:hypothetical protein